MEQIQNKENIWNVPNALTLSRMVITSFALFLILYDFHIFYIIAAFVIGMITDVLDGQIARRFKLTTEFGKKFDMIADRILMSVISGAILLKMGLGGMLSEVQTIAIIFMMLREIVSIPFFLIRKILAQKGIPNVRIIGKATTVMQAITFPIILLSTFYELHNIPLYFAAATGIVGLVSASYYIRDVRDVNATTKQSFN